MAEIRAKIGRQYTGISQQITVNNLRMTSQDIGEWKKAIDAARNRLFPRRRLLYELYMNIILDGHLLSVMNKRVTNILNKKIMWIEKDGKENEYVDEMIIDSPWFYDLIKYLMESVAFGHSLIELIPENGYIGKSVLINRANVKPENGFLMFDYYNESNGIYYRQPNNPYFDYLIESDTLKDNYGLLMTAAQYVIYKRGGFGDWAQFAEIFGMPFRVGKYNMYDADTRKKLEEALKTMGGAGYAVIPDGTSLEFMDNNQAGKSEVFKDMVTICNEEISKIFLGQTMTTEDGSSRSQGETHKTVEEEITVSDMIRIEHILNWSIKDKLINLGYNLKSGKFKFDRTTILSLKDRITIDLQVSEKVKIPDNYWYETYGVPKPTEAELQEMLDNDSLETLDPTDETEGTKKKNQ